MGEVASSPEPVRFGPFTADMRTGELRNSGLPIRLPGQSFQILATLLSRPGQTRYAGRTPTPPLAQPVFRRPRPRSQRRRKPRP
jgi:hypothetical protein